MAASYGCTVRIWLSRQAALRTFCLTRAGHYAHGGRNSLTLLWGGRLSNPKDQGGDPAAALRQDSPRSMHHAAAWYGACSCAGFSPLSGLLLCPFPHRSPREALVRNGAGWPQRPADVPAEPARKEGGVGPAHSSQGMRKYTQNCDPSIYSECATLPSLSPTPSTAP